MWPSRIDFELSGPVGERDLSPCSDGCPRPQVDIVLNSAMGMKTEGVVGLRDSACLRRRHKPGNSSGRRRGVLVSQRGRKFNGANEAAGRQLMTAAVFVRGDG